MYGQHSSLAATGAAGATGAGVFLGLSWGWLAFAVFVLLMAFVALLTILPRRRREVRKVNPPEAARLVLRPEV